MAQEVIRNYHCKDVDLLTAASVIVQNAISNITFLITKRTTWKNPFFPNLATRIDTAFSQRLGIDNSKDMHHATLTLISIQEPALDDLTTFTVQFDVDFRGTPARRAELLKNLGFDAHYKDAKRNKDQESLIELLYKFKTNMDAATKTEIVTAGMDGTLIDTIIGYAATLKNANVTQEMFKTTRPNLTAQDVTEFNVIYDTIIGVCKIASDLFKKDKAKQEMFTFSKILNNMNQPHPPKDDNPPPQPNT